MNTENNIVKKYNPQFAALLARHQFKLGLKAKGDMLIWDATIFKADCTLGGNPVRYVPFKYMGYNVHIIP